jgi:hypothetical protein
MLVLIVVIGIFILSGAVIIFASDRDSKLQLIRVEPEPMEEVKEPVNADGDVEVEIGPIKSHRVFVVRLRSIKGRSGVEETIAKYPEATLVNIETTSDETVMSFEQWE